MACFADINVSQGSVATYARCGGIFTIHLTANLLRNLPVNFFKESVKILQNYGQESVAPLFWPTLYTWRHLKLGLYSTSINLQSRTIPLPYASRGTAYFTMEYASGNKKSQDKTIQNRLNKVDLMYVMLKRTQRPVSRSRTGPRTEILSLRTTKDHSQGQHHCVMSMFIFTGH